jgi:enamine deaminase RidA (YjgF/YER057c/UK114 family)
MLYVSGHPSDILGKLGDTLTVAEGYQGARQAAVNCLSAVKGAIGDLDRIKQFVKLLGMVNCTPDFIDQPYVINGATDLLTEAFGKDVGAHARSAVGMVSLPRGIAVELEMILELKEE